MSSSTEKATSEKAVLEKPAPDNSLKIAVLTLIILTLLVAPDWVAYWGRSAYNTLPMLPPVPVHQPTQTIAQRLEQVMGSAIDRLTGRNEAQRITNALIGQESGGNALVQNHSGSGAMGLGQIMPENISATGHGWDYEALGRDLSESEFLASPGLQRQIIRFKVGQYWRSAIVAAGGNKDTACQRVAAAWYSGDPDLYTSTKPQAWNGDAYPSIAEYARSVCDRAGL